VPLVTGGTADHVHLLVGFKSSHRLDYFVRDLKADSSEWIHKEIGRPGFACRKVMPRSPSVHRVYCESKATLKTRKGIIGGLLFKTST